MATSPKQVVAWPTVVGFALLFMPFTTMWHEIGGHALTCVALGGRASAIGAFYVDCEGLAGAPRVVVSLAGAAVDAILAAFAYRLWTRARGDTVRLAFWYLWVGKAFVAAGYLCFSGVSGFGDLAPGAEGGLGPLPYPLLWRGAEFVVGIALYIWLVRRAIATLNTMVGQGGATVSARRRIAHGYYTAAGAAAVLVGLLNPMGVVITLMSAAASSFGGLAGLISVGFASGAGEARPFVVPSRWSLFVAGAALLAAFALVLGPTLHP